MIIEIKKKIIETNIHDSKYLKKKTTWQRDKTQ